jgi:hypothetical protein
MFVLLTFLPTALVGGVLWYFASQIPGCTISETERLASPDSAYDLVTFSRDCGDTTGPNSQAVLIPAGDIVPEDATSFASVGAIADLAPRWDGFGNIELTLPEGAEIYRNDDTVAGIPVIYR